MRKLQQQICATAWGHKVEWVFTHTDVAVPTGNCDLHLYPVY